MLHFILRKQLKRITVWPLVCAASLVGVALAYVYVLIVNFWLVFPLIVIVGVAVWRRTLLAVFLGVLAGVLLGNVQTGLFMQSIASYDTYRAQKVTIEGVVSEDPSYSKNGNKQFVMQDVVLRTGQTVQTLPGTIFVSTPTSPDIQRHNKVLVTGKLGDAFGPFQASVWFAGVQVISREHNVVDEWRQRFAAATASVLPEPHASLGLGFTIGMKSALTNDMSESLKALSLTHIVVASGYNLTILVRAAKRLREKHSKRQTLLLSFSLITVFLLVTGNSPSMVRAALVSGLALLAWYVGRAFRPHVLLLLVMAATALAYPPYLSDLGWWLSFSAFAGIMIVAPLLTERIYKKRTAPLLAVIAIETMVAEMMTLPIILLVFGNLSLLGVVANVLVGPLIPLAMLGTAVAAVSELTIPWATSVMAAPAHLILSLIVAIVRVLSSLPWATTQVFISPLALVIWYVGFGGLSTLLWWRLSSERKRAVLRQQIV